MDWKKTLLYSQNWNIGFCNQTLEEVIRDKKLSNVRWLKHPYRDRWFADPFIYKITDTEIVVFVEECFVKKEKGIIVELVVDRRDYSIKKEYVLLELDTHLSYPAFYIFDGQTYLYPENGQSGSLTIYEYNETNHQLVNPRKLVEEPLADATIWKEEDSFYMLATKYPHTQDGCYLFKAPSLFGPFRQLYEMPVINGLSSSRLAGQVVSVDGNIYRPFQDCSNCYGGALGISAVKSMAPEYSEAEVFKIYPLSFKYNLGIHTINQSNGMLVIDGYGYLYPITARFLKWIVKIKSKLF